LATATAEALPGEAQETQAQAALDLLDRAARFRAPTVAYHLCRAEILVRLGRESGAANERERFAARRAESGALDEFLLGVEQYRDQSWGSAAAHFEQAVQREPKKFWPHLFLATCYLNNGEPARSASELNACRALRDDLIWVDLLQGLAHRAEADASSSGMDMD